MVRMRLLLVSSLPSTVPSMTSFDSGVGPTTTVWLSPELCRAEVTLQGSIADFGESHTVVVGPTPLSKLVIEGTVEGKDDTNNSLILTIDDMVAPAGEEAPDH